MRKLSVSFSFKFIVLGHGWTDPATILSGLGLPGFLVPIVIIKMSSSSLSGGVIRLNWDSIYDGLNWDIHDWLSSGIWS